MESRPLHPFNLHNPTLHATFQNCGVERLNTENLSVDREEAMTYSSLRS